MPLHVSAESVTLREHQSAQGEWLTRPTQNVPKVLVNQAWFPVQTFGTMRTINCLDSHTPLTRMNRGKTRAGYALIVFFNRSKDLRMASLLFSDSLFPEASMVSTQFLMLVVPKTQLDIFVLDRIYANAACAGDISDMDDRTSRISLDALTNRRLVAFKYDLAKYQKKEPFVIDPICPFTKCP